jgi:ABC-type sugar transport system permease subunit
MVDSDFSHGRNVLTLRLFLELGASFRGEIVQSLRWKELVYATGDIGDAQTLAVSILFLLVAFVYFVFPRVERFQRREKRSDQVQNQA